MLHSEDRGAPGGGFWTPPPTWNTTKRVYTAMPMSERKRKSSIENQEPFEMIHKAPSGDSSYVRAKHAQLISEYSDRAISLFWSAISAGDRVDIALKNMALSLKQLNRSDEGIEAIKSFRYLCPFECQDSIDNLLLELYKKSGRNQEEAELLEHKLKTLEQEGGRVTEAKGGHGKQNNMTIKLEKARILGNLAWVHLQLHNYGIAEHYYRNALYMEPDNDKLCNLAICLIRMDKIPEAKSLLDEVRQSLGNQWMKEPFGKSFERANEMLEERERATLVADSQAMRSSSSSDNFSSSCSFASWMKTKQDASFESDEENSPGLFTHPWGDEEVNQRKGQATIGAARSLRFEKTLEVRHVKSVETAASSTNGKKLDNNLIDQVHFSGNSYCMTSKSRKISADLDDLEDNEKGCQSSATESSA